MKSNEMLLIMRQNLISKLKKYEAILLPIFRFIISLIALIMLKQATGYEGFLSSILMMCVIALIGAFASTHCIEICSIFLAVLFILPAHPILAIIVFMSLAMIYILYGRLFPGESLIIILTLMAFYIHLEMLVPILVALLCSYASIVAIILGTIIWFVVPELQMVLPSMGVNKSEILDMVEQLLSMDIISLISNQAMMVICVVFFIVFSAIFIVRKLPIDYGPYIAIGIGAIMNIVGFGLATIFFMEIQINLLAISLETIVFSLIAAVIQFLSKVLDYQRAESVSFEDDDNYYYVRIVPKIKINFKENKIKKVYTDSSQTGTEFSLFMEDDGFNNEL